MLQSKRKTVGIRVPDHPVTLALARAFAKPIVSTSTTVNNKTLLNADEINLHMGHGLDLILDADHIDKPPSSVVEPSPLARASYTVSHVAPGNR